MGLSKLIRRRVAPEFVIDPACGNETARSLRAQLVAGHWDPVSHALRRTRDGTTRWFLVRVLADWSDRPDFVEAWSQARPDDPLAWTLRGAHSLHWAWQARGTSRAEFVDDWRWERFNERLEAASEELRHARRLDPDDPTPGAFMLRCGMGLNWEDACASQCLADILQACPDHLGAMYAYLTFVSGKWHGTHARMFEFARDMRLGVPDGDERHGLIAMAHIERWLFAEAFKQDRHADEYWLETDVQREIADAWACSVANPAHRDGPLTLETRHAFLFCFAMMSRNLSERHRMRHEADRIGRYVAEVPWRYLGGDPVSTYANIWKSLR